MTQLITATPILPTHSIPEGVTFFRDKLGFNKITYQDGGYAILWRDDASIHLWVCEDEHIRHSSACYIYLSKGIEELYAEYQAQGVVHPNGALKQTPYQLKEFSVLTYDGVLLRIGQRLV